MATRYPRRVDEVELENLAARIAPSFYQQLGTNLGISYAQLEQVKTKHQLDMKDAIKDILVCWQYDRSTVENTRETLADILTKSGLRQLGDQLRKCDEEIRPKETKPARPTSQQATASTRPEIHVNQTPSAQSTGSRGLGDIVNMVSSLLPQHQSHIYNASLHTLRVILRDQNNAQTTRVLPPKQYCCIPTPWGRVAVSAFKKSGSTSDGFESKPVAQIADNSDRSFIVKQGSDGESFVLVRSVYGHIYTEEH
ncbi:uncharacterized protein [Diadema antillarum]|uniref:uncharacterized protein n=1 Tax=Diadema antillarum TaxID=105358 RepID=UPI003A899026